jgi:signal transduction histidine kinase
MSETTTGTVRRLEHANEELERFAYGAAHDLKGPLRGIRRLAGFVLEDVGDTLPPASRRHLQQIEERADQLDELVDGLLSYATIRPEALPRSPVDVAELARALWDLRDYDGFELQLACAVPVIVAPRAALQRVLNNLLGNAVAHHDTGRGTVTVVTRAVPGFVELVVEDDGPGVPAAQRERAMELFTTLGGAGMGTGIGLALVRRTVQQLGGTVLLEPATPRGLRVVTRWSIPRSPPGPDALRLCAAWAPTGRPRSTAR